MQKISAFCLEKQKSFVPKKDSTPWLTPIGVNQEVEIFLGTKHFCLSRQKAQTFSMLMIQNFMKPYKISAFYLDKQKSFDPKKRFNSLVNTNWC